jgi:hypothetical protein
VVELGGVGDMAGPEILLDASAISGLREAAYADVTDQDVPQRHLVELGGLRVSSDSAVVLTRRPMWYAPSAMSRTGDRDLQILWKTDSAVLARRGAR